MLRKVIAPSFYQPFAREGINTRGANGVFFVDACVRGGQTFVTNKADDGRNREVERHEASIETEHLYPLLRGRDVKRWNAEATAFVLLPHSPTSPVEPVKLAKLPKRTREFLQHFRTVLASRKRFRNFDPSGREFYGVYSVLSATFSPYKVVWREMADGALAAVCSVANLPDGSEKVVIPDHKLFVIPCISLEESHFVAGVFNSGIASYLIKSYALSTGISTHVLNRLYIPQYDPLDALHKKIQALAADASNGASRNENIVNLERDIDIQVGTMYGLSGGEVEILHSAHNELKPLTEAISADSESGGDEDV